jgi:trehalose 6-phosphate phosphatase
MHWQAAQSTLLRPLLEPGRLGLITDMDGTVSHIVEHPDAAKITPRCRALLDALQEHLALVAVISGRAVVDLRQRVGLPGLVYVGNHGLERWRDDRVELAPAAATFRPALKAAVEQVKPRQVPGLQIEDKGATVSIHYRRTADPPTTAAVLEPFLRDLAAQHNLNLFQGRMVFELRPPVTVDKGSAFTDLTTQYRLDAAVYLGDDTTDIDALQAARRLRESGACYALGLGVDAAETPDEVRANADLLLAGVQDVESFLDWLLRAVSASST